MKLLFLRNRIFWLNFSFWALFFGYKFYDYTVFMGAEQAFARIGLPMFFHIILSYTHYFFILPDLLKDKKVLPYFLKLVPTIAVIMLASILAENKILVQYSSSNYYQTVEWVRVVSTFWDHMSFMIFTGMIKFAVDWFELQHKKKELENEKLSAELNYLKAQINPHFLFNTLHNLNYLTQAKMDEATQVVIKLSNIMRYMIYESNKSSVPLSKEISYMRDYLDLESIRINNDFIAKFDTSELDDSIEIAPLVLIPFLENAFKHGISDKHPGCWLSMKISSSSNEIVMNLENSIVRTESKEDDYSGFGLKNVRRRLELSYPDCFELVTVKVEEVFSVHLKLILKQ